MGYSEIARLRNLFRQDTEGLLNQTQRLILWTICSYENPNDPRGCFAPLKDLLAETHLKARAWHENLHHLTDGAGKWENNKRVPCSQINCQGKDTHLRIVNRTGRAYSGNAQGHKLDLDQYEFQLSMRHGAPLELDNSPDSVHLETVKGAPINIKGSRSAHPYKQDIHVKQLQESSYLDQVNSFLNLKLGNNSFIKDPEISTLLSELQAKSFTPKAVEGALEAVGAPDIYAPKVFIRSRLKELLKGEPDWSMDNLPPHCGECDPVTRKLPYRWNYPSGASTDQCPKCNPYELRKKSA